MIFIKAGEYTKKIIDYKNIMKQNDFITKEGEIVELHDKTYENVAMDFIRLQEQQEEKKKEEREKKDILEKINQQNNFKEYIKTFYGSFYFYFYSRTIKNIEPQYLTRFLYLCTYINYDNILIIDKNTRHIPIYEEDLQSILKVSRAESFRTKAALLNNNLISIKDNGIIKINDSFCKKGDIMKNNKIDKTRMFNNSIKELYEKSLPREHKKLALLFQILPYINLKYNIICKNPNEEVQENIDNYTLKELMEELGQTNITRFKNDLLKLTVGGEPVISIHLIGKSNCIVINPKVYYKGGCLEDLNWIEKLIGMVIKDTNRE